MASGASTRTVRIEAPIAPDSLATVRRAEPSTRHLKDRSLAELYSRTRPSAPLGPRLPSIP